MGLSKCFQKCKSYMTILQWNAEGLGRTKQFEINTLLYERSIHVALIQETTLKDKVPLRVPGYKTYNCACKHRCQGIITLVKNNTKATVIQLKTNDKNDIHIIKIRHNGHTFTLYNICSAPNTTFDAKLKSSQFTRTILAGDTNAHSPCWDYVDRNTSGKYIESVSKSTHLTLIQNILSKKTLVNRPVSKTFRPDQTLSSSDIEDQSRLKVLHDLGIDDCPILITKDAKQEVDNHQNDSRGNVSANLDRKKLDNKSHSSVCLGNLQCKKKIDSNLKNSIESLPQVVSGQISKENKNGTNLRWNDHLQEVVNNKQRGRHNGEQSPSIDIQRKCKNKSDLVTRFSKQINKPYLETIPDKAWTNKHAKTQAKHPLQEYVSGNRENRIETKKETVFNLLWCLVGYMLLVTAGILFAKEDYHTQAQEHVAEAITYSGLFKNQPCICTFLVEQLIPVTATIALMMLGCCYISGLRRSISGLVMFIGFSMTLTVGLFLLYFGAMLLFDKESAGKVYNGLERGMEQPPLKVIGLLISPFILRYHTHLIIFQGLFLVQISLNHLLSI